MEMLIHSTYIKVKKQSYEKNDLVFYGQRNCFDGLRTGKAGKSARDLNREEHISSLRAALQKRQGNFWHPDSLWKSLSVRSGFCNDRHFRKGCEFCRKAGEAGTYTLFVIPNEQSWTIILNSQLGQWGAYDYDKYKDKDILHADVPVKKLNSPVEQLTISLPPSAMNIEWDNVEVSIPVSFS